MIEYTEDDFTRAREQAEDFAAEVKRECGDASDAEVLVIYPCDEQASHGDCWNVFNGQRECVAPHVSYADGYHKIYGCYPDDDVFDPFLDVDEGGAFDQNDY